MNTKYLIDTPPPTISGNLHIGHMFSYTQGDIIANYQKYLGNELIYPFCFDNNGIPTGKLASNKNIKGTQNIIDFSIKKSKEYHENFSLCGIKFSETSYHTYNDISIQTAYRAFEILKQKGIAYKKETEYLYCTTNKTSISQSELTSEGLIERTGLPPEIKIGLGWFINIKDHISEIKNMINQIDIKPIKFKKWLIDWCDDIKWDWSISRERHFGIPIPGEENMTFDTWFISSMTPQITWNSYTNKINQDCPIFDIRFQSHDIIRTWAFYTIAMSMFMNNQIPWKTLMITGQALDEKGNKFSKSLGNGINPIPFIQQYKISGLRHWATSSELGNDIKIDIDKLKMGWRICNKFNNAKKFIDMQISNNWIGEDEKLWKEYLEWKSNILSCLDNIQINDANQLMYEFLWNTFCDKWIEESKKDSTSLTLKKILDDFENIFRIIYL